MADGDTIFTREQHEQLLQSAVERASTEARAAADAEVLSLNEQLTVANQTIADRDATIEELRAQIAERDEAERLATLAEERAKLVQEAANFSADQVKARKETWAKMAEGDFAVYLEDIREAAKASGEKTKLPETKLDGTRETAGDAGDEKSVITAFFGDASVQAAARA